MKNWINKIELIDKDFFSELGKTSHAYSKEKQNPYHLEHNGNILGHVMDVFTEACNRFPEDEILQLGALLHDIAKPACRELIEEKQRVSFYNHESLGVFYAIDILNKLNLKSEDKVRVLEIIQRHADSYNLSPKNLKRRYSKESFEDCLKIRECDMYGRVALEGNRKDVKAFEEAKVYDIKDQKGLKEFSKTCTLLVGPPCSGKSTYLENTDKTIISRDNILMELAETDNYSVAWNEVNQDEINKKLQENINKALQEDKDVIFDMTNMTFKSRMQKIERFKNKFNMDCVVFLTPFNELLKRNKLRTNKVLNEGVITNMCKSFQMPYDGEGFRSITYKFN